jgi:SNF2 family DNA or RNA helicase
MPHISCSSPPWANGLIAVTFPYEPRIVAAIKRVPGRKWNEKHRAWTIPATPEAMQSLRAALGYGSELRLDPSVERRLEDRSAALSAGQRIRERGDGTLAFSYRTEPYAHQRAGLEYLVKLGSGALLWEMGLGKTKTAIDYCEYLAARQTARLRVLVICPNSVRLNWRDEVMKHAGHDGVVVPTGTAAARIALLGSEQYTVINCEALSIETIGSAIEKHPWDVVIVDESTRFKSPTAKRTKRLLKMKPAVRVILTGTPLTNSPQDAWAQFEWVDPGLFGSWWSFQDRYLVKDFFGGVKGIKPGLESELRSRIESRSYRLLKEQVLDLPPKVYEDRRVELSGEQARLYREMRDDLRATLADTSVSAANILTQLLRLTQITAGMIGSGDRYSWLAENAKQDELDTLLQEELDGKQVVIFGLYHKELEELAARYASRSARPPIIYGPTPEAERHDIVSRFQRGDERLLFAQARTGGIGINLTAAQYAVYYTRGWSLEEYLQSQDRLHRIGQQGTVTVVHLVAQGTVDEQIARALAEKSNMAATLTGDGARRLAAEVLGGMS